jgi:hypothetical protein
MWLQKISVCFLRESSIPSAEDSVRGVSTVHTRMFRTNWLPRGVGVNPSAMNELDSVQRQANIERAERILCLGNAFVGVAREPCTEGKGGQLHEIAVCVLRAVDDLWDLFSRVLPYLSPFPYLALSRTPRVCRPLHRGVTTRCLRFYRYMLTSSSRCHLRWRQSTLKLRATTFRASGASAKEEGIVNTLHHAWPRRCSKPPSVDRRQS